MHESEWHSELTMTMCHTLIELIPVIELKYLHQTRVPTYAALKQDSWLARRIPQAL
uniref:Uncharacterized protein n=1 Tax=Arundo donax TaxID=35708 RepID=A0A0A8ZXP5_ARUDO